MPTSKRSIWLTRPLEDSRSFATELRAHDITSIIAPVLHIARQPLPALAIAKPSALLITSRHAAHALAALPAEWRALPTYCVGEATERAATEQGCSNTITGSRDALALLPRITADLGSGSSVLYLAGDESRTDLAQLLTAQGVQVSTVVVYRAIAERGLGDDIRGALADKQVGSIVFFSPRSAEIACKLLKQAGLIDAARSIDAYCLSLAVAEAAGALHWRKIHACHVPTRDAMLNLIVSERNKTL